MNKNNNNHNKKAQILTNLIPLGQKNKVRNALPSQSTAKRVKIEDLNPSTLITTIEQSMKQDNGSSETLIINFLNSVKSTMIISSKNGKILPSQCLPLFCLCKKFPGLFSKQSVIDCICGILNYSGKDPQATTSGIIFKQQSSQTHSMTASKLKQLHIAVCCVLMASLKDNVKWPLALLKAYFDDSLSERVWVDLPECGIFVRNLETAFPAPGIDPRVFFPPAAVSEQLADICEVAASLDEKIAPDSTGLGETTPSDTVGKVIVALTPEDVVRPRYDYCRAAAETMAIGYVKEVVEKKYIHEAQVKSVIRTLCAVAGLPEARGMVVVKLDNWILQSKSHTPTTNLLTVMASSCNQNIAQSTADTAFCVYLMLRFKYKTSKPQVQITLLDCLKRVSEMHPNNLRNMLHIYVNSELYNSPTVTTTATVATVTQSLGSSKAAAVTLPAIHARFPAETVRVLGELLHEQMCTLFADIRPVKVLLREMCRWVRLSHANPGGVYTQMLVGTAVLPDSLDLLELAQSLLADRTASESVQSRLGQPLFRQAYVDNMVGVLCELQMLSAIRPCVRDALRDKQDHDKRDLESIRHHYTTVRQIRFLTCKWLKSIFRLVEAQVAPERMAHYVRQVMFLNVTRGNGQTYTIDDSYAINEVWANEPDKTILVKGLTEIPLSEKLIHTMLSLGFEKHLCYRPSEIVEMLSELIIRASACASTDILPMNVTKGEIVINNMFSCCNYDLVVEDGDPRLQVAKTLAFKSSFWKVCQALVVMACHCTETCGAFLWANYPTIKNLMKMVITNNIDNSSMDEEALETERLHCETDAAKVLELERALLAAEGEDAGGVDLVSSRLVPVLMLNLPQGATRLPPLEVLQSLQSINRAMKIGDRLSQCRQPDFLLEIVKGQDQSKVASRKWILDLVKKTSEQSLESLPLLCLTEFIYHDLYDRFSSDLPLPAASTNDTFKTLVLQIRNTLANSSKMESVDTVQRIVGAFSNSFFNRLSDPSSLTRTIARECLFILLQPVGSAMTGMTSTSQFMDTLKTLINLKVFQENVMLCSIVESLKETLNFETDIDVLGCYIELFASMSTAAPSSGSNDWLVCVVETLATLILNRPLITEKLTYRDYKNLKDNMTSPLVSDLLAEIFLSYMSYVQEAQAIAIDHHGDVVMVTWKDKKLPLRVKVVQCQLSLLTWGVAKSPQSRRLCDTWVSKVSKGYELPQFSPLSPESPYGSPVVPQWLVDAAMNCGIPSLLVAVLHHHSKVNCSLIHSVSTALIFQPADFQSTYLKTMNAAVKEDRPLLDAWVAGLRNGLNVLATIEPLFSKMKRVSSAFVDFLRGHLAKSSDQVTVSDADLKPRVIVRPVVKAESPLETTIEPMEDGETEDADVGDVWGTLVHSQGIAVTAAVNRLLASRDCDPLAVAGGLTRLLRDTATHSETLRVLNKSDYRLLPLLRLTFRGYALDSLRRLFKAYPHVEKLPAWRAAMQLCVLESSDESDADHGHDRENGENEEQIDRMLLLGASEDALQRLLFASHCPHRSSALLTGGLLHQAGPAAFSGVLHSLLRRKASSLASVDAERVLDFIDAVVRHPRLQFPAHLPSARRHLWPEQNVPVCLSEIELSSLLALVVAEAEHIVQRHGLSSPLVAHALARRCRLLDVLGHPRAAIRRFLEGRPHLPTAAQVAAALYARIPGLGSPGAEAEDAPPSATVHRIGRRLLTGLLAPADGQHDLASQALSCLVLRHPHLARQLLPHLAALVDGVLDARTARTVLHLLELLSPPPDCPATAAIAGNLLRLLSQHRDAPSTVAPIAARLTHFLQRWDGPLVQERLPEVTVLARAFPTLRALLGGPAEPADVPEPAEAPPASPDELRQLLARGQHLAVQRHLSANPRQAPRLLVDGVLASAAVAATHYWARPAAAPALAALARTAMLAPDAAPACISLCGRLLAAGSNGRGSHKEALGLLEDVVDSLSLEAFLDGALVPEAGIPAAALKKEATVAVSQKRQFQQPLDHESHKPKRPRLK